MKRFIALLTAALLGILPTSAGDIKEQVTKEQLPQAAQDFISEHFASTPFIRAIKETDGLKVEYEVLLEEDVYLKFRESGEWKEVESKTAAVPSSVVPDKIQTAAASKCPKSFIVQIERKRAGWEIEMSDGTEIEFDSSFKITDIDR